MGNIESHGWLSGMQTDLVDEQSGSKQEETEV